MAITLNNSANITYNYAGLTDLAASNIATTRLVEDYSLTAVKQANNSGWRPSENLTFIIRIENTGTNPLFAVSVQDNLGGQPTPPLTFVPDSVRMIKDGVVTSVTPTSIAPLTFDMPGELGAGESVVFSYVAKVRSNIDPAVEEITNTATVTGHETSASGPVVTVEPPPSLTLHKTQYAEVRIEKSADKDLVATGETLTYTFWLENSGNTDATNVVLVDNLPEKFTVVSIKSETNGSETTFDAADYSLDASNKLILPTSVTKTISVPAAASSGNGVTNITISGTITA